MMSTEANTKADREPELFPIHNVFLASFFAPSADPFHALTTPCGAGTFNFLIALILRAINQHGANRVLVVVPQHLHDACQWMLAGKVETCSIERVTFARFRELEAQKMFGQPLWPATTVAILDEDTVARPEVSYSLATTKWDLVVCDTRDTRDSALRGAAATLGVILQRNSAARFLLMRIGKGACLKLSAFEGCFTGTRFTETVWDTDDIKDRDGRPVLRISGLKTVKWKYSRSPAERDILRQVDFLLDLLSDNDQAKLIRDTLLRRSASGIPALELGIHMLLKNCVNHYEVNVSEEHPAVGSMLSGSSVHDAFSQAASQITTVWQNPARAVEHLGSSLSWALDELPGDFKLDSFMTGIESRLLGVGHTSRRICVFTSFNETASYLHSALTDEHGEEGPIHLLTDATSMANRQQSLESSADKLQIFVATSGAFECSPRLPFTGVVHYDLPSSPCEMLLRLGACRSVGQHFVVVDETEEPTEAAEYERSLVTKHGAILGW